MSKPNCALFIALFVFSFISEAQKDSTRFQHFNKEKELSLHLGVAGGRYIFGELGIGLNKFRIHGHHPASTSIFIANEVALGKNLVIGPKIGAHIMGGLAMGVNFIYYTDFDYSSIVFRPDIGIGLFIFRMTYGYNYKLSNKSFDKINTHLINVAYFIKLKKLNVHKKDK